MDYAEASKLALENPESYWSPFASKLAWYKTWDKVELNGRWFVKGETNLAENVLRHQGIALIWYGEGERRELSYSELSGLVEKVSSLLKERGVRRGDRVAIHMPNLPETIATMLACAKMGVTYSVIFAGLGAAAVRARIDDLSPKLVVSTQYTQRRGNKILLLGGDLVLNRGLEPLDERTESERIESNEPMMIMYTSGTTGKPKGIVLPHGSWMVGHYVVFDIMFSLRPGDKVFTTADVGWITFSRIAYGTLLHGGTLVFMEGAPDHPRDRIPSIMREESPKVFFTSPTLLRMLRTSDVKLERIEYLATAGEIFDEPSWDYAMKFADKVTDVYGQSETGYVAGTPFALSVEPKKGFAGVPFPGALLETVNENGEVVRGRPGYLILKGSFPTKFVGVWRNEAKFKEYERFGGHDTGDVAIFEGSFLKIVGRNDDMIKIAGHRITSGEVEDLVSKIPGVRDVSAVGVPDEIKGERLILFVVGEPSSETIREEVKTKLGPIYLVEKVIRVKRLPKSRSGKVVRRVLRDLVMNKEVDPTILEDPEVIDEIKEAVAK
ncbi:MAG: AMP-binding protein [Metallosphaera sp.]